MNDETKQSTPPVDGVSDRLPTGEDTLATPPPPQETLAPDVGAVARPPAFASQFAVVVPGYEIIGELGRGGMGIVYKALHVKLHRVVALKMVLSAHHADPRELRRFLAEAEAVAAIRHPHVVQIYDSGEADGRPFMAMECLEGGSLVQRLRAEGRMPPHAAAELVLKITRGVQAAHDRGIIHRDLKPHNVLLDPPPAGAPPGTWGEPKVTDFGLAKRGGSDLTQTGAIMGTPAYMAPEQAMGDTKRLGPRADVYALGVILYECLAGSVPFTGEDAWSVIRRVTSEEPDPVTRRAAGIPRDLDLICRKCLEKKPEDRYLSASELADDLERFIHGEAIRGPRTDIWYSVQRTSRRWWRPVAVLVALVTLLLGVWILPSPFHRNSQTKVEPPATNTGTPREDPLVTLRREEVTRRVEALLQMKPLPDTECPHPLTKLPDLPPTSLAGFRVLNDDRVVDLRAWRPNPSHDPGLRSFVIYHDKRELEKLRPVNELRVETRTSGYDLVMRGLRPNPTSVKAFASEKPRTVGSQMMKRRQLVFDTSDVPVDSEFTVRYTSTYCDSFQTDTDRWFGVIGYEGSFKVSMLLLFPRDRPYQDYQLRVAPQHPKDPKRSLEPVPYTGPVITFAAADRSWLYWEIPNPGSNSVYRIDWKW